MFVAYYAADNQTEEFDTFQEAKDWLEECWDRDSGDEGFAEESINGQDYIAKVTHVGKFIEKGNKKKDGFVFDEDAGSSFDADGEEWAVGEQFDFWGEMVLEEIKEQNNTNEQDSKIEQLIKDRVDEYNGSGFLIAYAILRLTKALENKKG